MGENPVSAVLSKLKEWLPQGVADITTLSVLRLPEGIWQVTISSEYIKVARPEKENSKTLPSAAQRAAIQFSYQEARNNLWGMVEMLAPGTGATISFRVLQAFESEVGLEPPRKLQGGAAYGALIQFYLPNEPDLKGLSAAVKTGTVLDFNMPVLT